MDFMVEFFRSELEAGSSGLFWYVSVFCLLGFVCSVLIVWVVGGVSVEGRRFYWGSLFV